MNQQHDNASRPRSRKQWSIPRVILSLGFQPRTMAARVSQIPLRKAFMVGVVSLLLGWIPVVLICFPILYMFHDFIAGFSWNPSPSLFERFQVAFTIGRESFQQTYIWNYAILAAIAFLISSLVALEVSGHDLRWVQRHKRVSHCFKICWLQLIQLPFLLIIAAGLAGSDYYVPQKPIPPTPPTAYGTRTPNSTQRNKYLYQRELYLKRKDIYSHLNKFSPSTSSVDFKSNLLVTSLLFLLWLLFLRRAFPLRYMFRKITSLNDEGHPICFKCEYDLHGQPVSARCPECGMLVLCSITHRYMYRNHEGIYVAGNPAIKKNNQAET